MLVVAALGCSVCRRAKRVRSMAGGVRLPERVSIGATTPFPRLRTANVHSHLLLLLYCNTTLYVCLTCHPGLV